MNNIKISYKRHLAKTISYRLVSTTIGFAAMWLVTGSLKIGAAFGIAELLYKPIQYYIHERIWYRWIKFGVIKDSEKKKKNSSLTEDKTKTQTDETNNKLLKIDPLPSQKTSEKKILNYNSNR